MLRFFSRGSASIFSDGWEEFFHAVESLNSNLQLHAAAFPLILQMSAFTIASFYTLPLSQIVHVVISFPGQDRAGGRRCVSDLVIELPGIK